MPKKKASEVSSVAGGVAVSRIHCPACKSEISGDGATLHTLSPYLEELIEEAGGVPKLEKALDEMEVKLTAERAESKKWKAEAEAKSKPEVKKDETVGPKVGSGKPVSNPWW